MCVCLCMCVTERVEKEAGKLPDGRSMMTVTPSATITRELLGNH